MTSMKKLGPASPQMGGSKKSQRGGAGCGANNKKMNGGFKKTQKGGAGCGANNKKMNGGASKSKKTTKKASAPNVGYCLRCREKVTMANPTDITKKTAKRTMKMRVGTCPKCKGKVYKIVGA
jgi:Zn finger protein HypA/HybF involved in hydrogenase expression